MSNSMPSTHPSLSKSEGTLHQPQSSSTKADCGRELYVPYGGLSGEALRQESCIPPILFNDLLNGIIGTEVNIRR